MFDKNYYCLVAGLREYSLDADTKGFNARAIIEAAFSFAHCTIPFEAST